MPGPANTLLIEGSFSELSEELARYLDSLNKTDPTSGVEASIAPNLTAIREREQEQGGDLSEDTSLQKRKDDILKQLVGNAAIITNAPDKGMQSRLWKAPVRRC